MVTGNASSIMGKHSMYYGREFPDYNGFFRPGGSPDSGQRIHIKEKIKYEIPKQKA